MHGGMGFIEETGAAQYARDVRITTIYEGTTGIQANDLIGRKIGRDGGAAIGALLADMTSELECAEARATSLAQATCARRSKASGCCAMPRSRCGKALATSPGSGAGRRRAVPEAVRLRARRMAHGEVRVHRRGKLAGADKEFLHRQAAHRAFLRRAGSATIVSAWRAS